MKIISLFSGAGGFDLGLLQTGHEIVWANDNDNDAVETYKNNIGDHIFLGDIESVKSETLPASEVVIGGFPCQGFSQANMLRHNKDERNKLYLEFFRIIKDLQPFYFLAENVRGILSLAEGKAIQIIEKDFASAGYRVKKELFNMADYGVPQNRWRVIIAGTRSDLPENMDFSFPSPTHSHPLKTDNLGLKHWVTVGEALKGLPEPGTIAANHIPNHLCSKYKVTNRNFTGHRWTDPNKPSPTILARGNGKGGVCAIQHPLNHRRMSVRESALIQSFPLNFEFHGKLNSCYRQVGNALPSLFAAILGKELKKKERKIFKTQAA